MALRILKKRKATTTKKKKKFTVWCAFFVRRCDGILLLWKRVRRPVTVNSVRFGQETDYAWSVISKDDFDNF